MSTISARVHPQTERIHINRQGTRIGLVTDFDEAAQLVDDLREILSTWHDRREIERAHDEAVARGWSQR